MKGQFMMISSIVAGVILIGTAASISEVRSQNIEPEFARQEMDLIKEEASKINTSKASERQQFQKYVKSIERYESNVKYWENSGCFNITLENQLSKYEMSCVGNKTAMEVRNILLELDFLSDFDNKGMYNKLSAETSDIAENLTIGYRNGESSDSLKGFWRMDRNIDEYSVSKQDKINHFWTESSNPDLNIRDIQSDLDFQDSSPTTVTVNASNSGLGSWNVNVDLYNYSRNSVSWNHQSISTSNGAIEAIVPADIDHDGDADIVYGSAGENTIKFAENDGNGGGWSITTIGNQDVESVSVGDIDGDQDLDVVGGGNGGNIYVFENDNGDGSSWSRHDIGNNSRVVRSVALGDITGNGRLDIVSTGYNEEIRLWENDGTNSGWPMNTVGSGGRWTVGVANIDGDNEPDIVSGGDDGEVEFWDNVNGDGSTWDRNLIEDESDRVFSLAITDIDEDGDLDVFSGIDNSNNDINLYRNDDGSGTSWTTTNIDSRASSVRTMQIADIDLDSDKDLFTGTNKDGSDHQIEFHENDGSYSSWTGTAIGNQGDKGHYGLAIADFTGNGVLDVVSGEDESPADLRFWETQGINTSFLGSDQIEFTNSNGGSKQATVTWTPKKYTHNLMAEVNPSRNFTEVLETNDETAGSTNNRILQTVIGTSPVKDYSGEDNDAVNNGSIRGVDGVFSTNGTRFELDNNGRGDFINHSGLMGYPQKFTLATWVKIEEQDPEDGSDWADFFALGDYVLISSRENGYGEGISGFYHYSGGWKRTTYSSSDLEGTGWNHVAYTHDGNEQNLYINGENVVTTTHTAQVLWDGTLGNTTALGGNGYFDDRDLEGKMDESMFYNRALSQNEVKELYFDGDTGDYRGSYISDSRNIESENSLANLSVKSYLPAGTSANVIVSHSSGSSQTVNLDSGAANRNYSLSFSAEGGSADATINLDSSVPQSSPEIDRLRLWTSN